jgi:hypothetical protein
MIELNDTKFIYATDESDEEWVNSNNNQHEETTSIATAFMNQLHTAIDNNQFIQSSLQEVHIKREQPSVYVCQREFTYVDIEKNSHIQYIGSQFATTCCIVIFKYNKRIACAHIDGTDFTDYLVYELERFFGTEPITLETFIVGSYSDEMQSSIENVGRLIEMMHESKTTLFKIKMCHILDLNTRKKTVTIDTRLCHEKDMHYSREPGSDNTFNKTIEVNVPIFPHLTYEVATGNLVSATYEDIGPEPILRTVSSFMGDDPLLKVYDGETDQYIIGPKEDEQKYGYNTFDSPLIIDYLLDSPDQFILRFLSTSPYAEGDNFAEEMRSNLRFLKQYPDYTHHFPDDKPIVYKRDSVGWVRVQ